jgi:putative addiction module component (TIGR02574 family)
MSTTEIRQKLFDYIRVADDKKVKAFYTIIENEIKEEADIWTDEFLQELNKRTADFESGKVKGYTWDEVKSRAKEFAKAK